MYLFVDTETGGLDTSFSLLTVAAAVTDKDFNVMSQICFGVKPATYVVDPNAIRVNKINLAEHSSNSLSLEMAGTQFLEFLEENFVASNRRKLIPAGHNVKFDLDFIWSYLLPEQDWREFCTHPALDTAVLARFFAAADRIPPAFNLVALRQLFDIETGEAHSAQNDVMATIQVAKRFFALLNAQSV
jgi:DNA polymerase III alpha subunit (gram-positive type)